MPQFTALLTSEGLEMPIMVGLCSSDMMKRRAGGLPVSAPEVVTGIIDTGSNCCCISARVASLLGLVSLHVGSTQTAGGMVGRDLLAQLLLVLNGPRNEFTLAG